MAGRKGLKRAEMLERTLTSQGDLRSQQEGFVVDAKTDVVKRYSPSSITRSDRKLPA